MEASAEDSDDVDDDALMLGCTIWPRSVGLGEMFRALRLEFCREIYQVWRSGGVASD